MLTQQPQVIEHIVVGVLLLIVVVIGIENWHLKGCLHILRTALTTISNLKEESRD